MARAVGKGTVQQRKAGSSQRQVPKQVGATDDDELP